VKDLVPIDFESHIQALEGEFIGKDEIPRHPFYIVVDWPRHMGKSLGGFVLYPEDITKSQAEAYRDAFRVTHPEMSKLWLNEAGSIDAIVLDAMSHKHSIFDNMIHMLKDFDRPEPSKEAKFNSLLEFLKEKPQFIKDPDESNRKNRRAKAAQSRRRKV
jgi:hypothetical protein